jgi:hypothetical protein
MYGYVCCFLNNSDILNSIHSENNSDAEVLSLKPPAPVITLLLSMLLSVDVSSLDVAAWVKDTGRDTNSVVGDIILTEDSETSLRVIRALGQREDPYMEDIIERIFYQESRDIDEEYYLEVLLVAIYRRYNSPEKLAEWTNSNPRAYDLLLENLTSFKNAFLKTYIILLLPHGMTNFSKSFLMSESRIILDEMHHNDGYLMPGRIKEVLAIFEAVDVFNDTVFLEVCVSLVEGSRQRIVVSRGRSTIRRLAAETEAKN